MLRYLLIAVSCILLVACGQDGVESQQGKESLSLQYSAASHGRIEGLAEQQVPAGESGQTIRAVAAEGYHFTEWSDGVTEQERTDVNPDSSLQVTAHFAINRYPLTYSANVHGTVKGPAVQTVEHGTDGQEVTAVPAAGYRFLTWSDGVATATRIDRDVASALEVRARFAEASYQLEYVAAANGSIEGQQSQTLLPGEEGTPVKAVPAENYHFAGWSDGVMTAARVDRNLSGNLRLIASFATEMIELKYAASLNGTITGHVAQQVALGGSGSEVRAVPAPGYHFVDWSDGLTTARRLDAEVQAPLSVTANFAVNRYQLNYQAGEQGSIKGAAEQQVAHGSDAEAVVAIAKPDYRFVRWSDGVTSARRTDAGVVRDLQLTAEFELETYVIGGSVEGLVVGTELQLKNNAEETLTVSQNGTFRFAKEYRKGSRYEVELFKQPTAPTQTCKVSSGSGTVKAENVTAIEVVCTLNGYAVGGAITGLLEGDQVVLLNNDSDKLVLKQNGPFSFSQPLDDGSEYLVEIVSKPERRNWTCDLKNAAGKLAGLSVSDLRVECYQQVVLETLPGRRTVELTWNDEDFNAVTFNLCSAQEPIPEGGFPRCEVLRDGNAQSAVRNGHQVGDLDNDTPYWFQLEAVFVNGQNVLSEVVTATPFGGLNDTGIDWCADLNKNHQTDGSRADKERLCKALATGFSGQDGLHGRDAAARVRKLPKKGSGTGGFDFSKYCRSGEAAGERKCPANPQPGSGYDEWACTLDNVTGLTWEIKTDSGLRASNKSYFWYQPDEKLNGGDAGVEKGGDCVAEDCNTNAYVDAINQIELCGYNDWRLPTRRELLSIIDSGRINPAIDTRYFPNAEADYYWASTPYQDQLGLAWQVYFFYGESKPGEKSVPLPVRLVRGKTVTFGQDNH